MPAIGTAAEAANVTDYDWNDLGQLVETRVSGQGEAPLVTTLAYGASPTYPGVADLSGVRAAANTPEERHTAFAYQASGNGNLISSTDALGATTTYSHYTRGPAALGDRRQRPHHHLGQHRSGRRGL